MRVRALATLPFLVLLLSGCAGTEPAFTEFTPLAPTSAPPAPQLGQASGLESAPPPPGERTLAEAPRWRLGEWWTYRIRDQFTGNTFEVTRIVAGTMGQDYLVGFPVDAFSNDALVLHLPGVGDVAQADLSFEVHDARFHPLRFPLEAGDSWTTQFEGRNGTMLVESTSGGSAVLAGSGQGWGMNLTYDAEAGDLVRLSYPGYMDLELVAHGYGHQGDVRVPHAHDLVFFHGRVAGPLGLGLEPRTDQPITEEVVVPEGYDRLSFALIAGNVLLGATPQGEPLPASGVYRERATSPDGTVYELVVLPSDPALRVTFHGSDAPAGTWQLEHAALGPGLAFIEGIGYHSIDVRLPEGCTLPGPNSGHHATPCPP
jgi:hypothetical protein